MQVLQIFASFFASLVLVCVAVAGLVLMVAPDSGRQLLKNTGVAVALFVGAVMVLQLLCSAFRHSGYLMDAFYHLVGLAVAFALIACAFVYLFSPTQAQTSLKRVGIALAGLLFLPTLIFDFVRAVNPLAVCLAVIAVSGAAYWVREWRLRRPDRPQGLGRAERTPMLPRGGQDQ